MSVYQADLKMSQAFVFDLFKKHATQGAVEWLSDKQQKVGGADSTKDLYLAFSAAPGFVGRNNVRLEPSDLEDAEKLRLGFNPTNWNLAQTTRTLLLLATPHQDRDIYLNKLEQLFSTAEMGELAALYASLPLLSYPEAFKLRAAEGISTNIGSVFEAIALDNPYPADFLKERAWNQMVPKKTPV